MSVFSSGGEEFGRQALLFTCWSRQNNKGIFPNDVQAEMEKTFKQDHISGREPRAPLLNFFIERYQEAYMLEITSFAEMVINKTNPVVGFEDGHKALILAETAYRSVISGKMESIYN